MAIRGQLRTACAMAVLVVLAAPAALGAAMTPVLRDFAAQSEHVCKCGMAPGRCGCPECARLELQRQHERRPEAVSTIKSRCDGDAPALASAEMPNGVPTAIPTVLPAPPRERLGAMASILPVVSIGDAPPTPPPRLAAA